ncbi:MAG: hypothetical protein HC799_17160 [Limnothrix sp. RL_2_0]|nr:hypothetical protein [Limnothrix sp. RL_2_0]
MVAIEAWILNYFEGIARRDSIVYMFLVNLFSFNFGWLIVTLLFRFFAGSKIQDEILSYMLLGIVGEKLLSDMVVNPIGNPLLIAMLLYFGAIFYFELKMLTLLRVFVLPTGRVREEVELPLPKWIDRGLVLLLSKDFRLVMVIFLSNFVSHVAAGVLILLAQL